MCRAVNCRVCGKTTWAGCGNHVDAVKAGVPAELHIYEKGPHGIGLAKKFPGADQWSFQCENWLKGRGLLKK